MKDHSYWSHVDFSKEKSLLIKQNIICRQQRLLDLIIYKLQIILMKRKILWSALLTIIVIVIIIFPLTPAYTVENVKWKMSKDKNGIFTVKYPSNWSPIKPTTESPAPIDIYFFHAERGSFVTLTLFADESILSNNIDLMDSYLAYDQSEQKYRLIQPTECEKYMINTIKVCSAIDTFRLTTVDSKPMITQLIIGGIDSEGVEYGVTYRATPDLFDDFLPVAEEMIGSFNITGNILNSSGQLTQGAQSSEQPLFSESHDIKGI